MEVAKVFTDGNSQVIRLPDGCAFLDDEVFVNRIGDIIILAPKGSPWNSMIASLDMFTDDFMEDGRGELKLEEREAL